jgi:hypothetical protein
MNTVLSATTAETLVTLLASIVAQLDKKSLHSREYRHAYSVLKGKYPVITGPFLIQAQEKA